LEAALVAAVLHILALVPEACDRQQNGGMHGMAGTTGTAAEGQHGEAAGSWPGLLSQLRQLTKQACQDALPQEGAEELGLLYDMSQVTAKRAAAAQHALAWLEESGLM
jgi:hypothetical protein